MRFAGCHTCGPANANNVPSPTGWRDSPRLVAAGDAFFSPSVTRTLLSHFATTGASERQRGAARQLEQLTTREREVALAVGTGSSNAEIAVSLFMSEATVKAYVSRLLTKLGVGNRVQVAILVHDAAQAGSGDVRPA